MKVTLLAAILAATFGGSAHAQCVADPAASVTRQKSQEFACEADRAIKRDLAAYTPKMRAALASNQPLAALFSETSLRSAIVKDGQVVSEMEEATDVLTHGQIEALAAKAASAKGFVHEIFVLNRPGRDVPYLAMAAVGSDGRVIVSATPQDGAAGSAIAYARAATDEDLRAAGDARRAK